MLKDNVEARSCHQLTAVNLERQAEVIHSGVTTMDRTVVGP